MQITSLSTYVQQSIYFSEKKISSIVESYTISMKGRNHAEAALYFFYDASVFFSVIISNV